MKKRFIIGISIYLLLSSLIFSSNTVLADTIYSLDNGWEDEVIGAESGTSGYFAYERYGNDVDQEFRVSNSHSRNSTKSFQVKDDNSGESINGWWNLTSNFDYISKISFWVYADDNGVDGDIEMKFFNSSGQVLEISFDNADQGIDYEDYNGVDQEIWSGLASPEWVNIVIDHNDTNVMRYRIYNDTNVLKADVTGTSNYVGEWTSFTYIRFDSTVGPEWNLYFDNFNITTDSDSEWDTCSNNYWNVEKRFDDSTIGWNETAEFKIWHEDIIGPVGYTFAQVFDSNDDIVATMPGTMANPCYFWYMPVPDHGSGNFNIKVKDHTSDSWDLVCPFTVQTGSTSFGEWSIYTISNTYMEGDNVRVYYNIPLGYAGNLTVYKNNVEYYEYNMLVGTTYTDYVTLTDICCNGDYYEVLLRNYSDSFIMNSTDFFYITGENYFWELLVDDGFYSDVFVGEKVLISYDFGGIAENVFVNIYDDINKTNDDFIRGWDVGFGAQEGVITWYPPNLTAGDETFYIALYGEDSGLFYDGLERTVNVYDIESDVPVDEGELNLILGVFVVIGIGIGLLILTHEPIAFIGGSCATAFVLSSGALGSYQLLPVEVGYGLMVVLVLVAVITWLAN